MVASLVIPAQGEAIAWHLGKKLGDGTFASFFFASTATACYTEGSSNHPGALFLNYQNTAKLCYVVEGNPSSELAFSLAPGWLRQPLH